MDATYLMLQASDSESGVREIHYQTDWQDYTICGNPVEIPLAYEGIETFTYWAIDKAGNEEYPNKISIKIDKTPPTVTINSPANSDYPISGALTIDFTVEDDLSGVFSFSSFLDNQSVSNGQAVKLWTLSPGSHTFTINASDVVGNTVTKSVTFNVIVTTASLVDLIGTFLFSGFIDNDGVATGLIKMLENGTAGALLNYIDAQTGKHISFEAAEILRLAIESL